MNGMKKLLIVLVLLLALLAVLGAWHRDAARTVRQESAHIQACIEQNRCELDGRLERIEGKIDQLDGKMDRIEGKLDRLLKIAEQPLPDGMRRAE